MKSRINVNIYGISYHYYFSRLYISRILGVSGHETLHYVNDDGTGGISKEDAQEGQEAFSKNPDMSQDELKAKLIADGKTPEEAAKIAGEIFEDIRAHTFDTKIWGSLKKQFMIEDTEMDAKQYFLNRGEDDFENFLNDFYILGEDYSKDKNEYSLQKDKERALYEYVREDLNALHTDDNYKSKEVQDAIKLFYQMRLSYIGFLDDESVNEYSLDDFKKDFQVMLNREFDMSEKDFEKLKQNQSKTQFLPNQLENLSIDKVYFNMFNQMVTQIYLQGEDAQEKWDEIVEMKSHFDVSDIGYEGTTTWMFETFSPVNDPNDKHTFLEYYMSDLVSIEQLQNINNAFNYYDDEGNITDSITIDVYSSAAKNGNANNTHFIANAGLLFDSINDFRDGVENSLNASLDSFTWREGYRSIKEYADIYCKDRNGNIHYEWLDKSSDSFNKDKYKYYSCNPHANNSAIDITGVKIKDSEDENSRYLTGKEDLNLGLYLYNTLNYSFMELKGGGYHVGRNNYFENQNDEYKKNHRNIVVGNGKWDTESKLEFFAKVLGISEELFPLFKKMTEKYGSFYKYDQSAIDLILKWEEYYLKMKETLEEQDDDKDD